MAYSIDGLVRPHHIQEAIDAASASDTLADALAALESLRSMTRSVRCPKCGGTGVHERSLDTGVSGGSGSDLIECTFVSADDATNACLGWGYLRVGVVLDRGAVYGNFVNVPS